MFDHVFVYFYNGCFGTHTHTHTQNTQIHSSTSRSSSVNRLLPSMLQQSHKGFFGKFKLFDKSQVTWRFIEWKFFLLTYSCSCGRGSRQCMPPLWGILLAGGTSPCFCVGSCIYSCIRAPKRWTHGGWFVMRLTGRCRWSQPPSSRNKLAYIRKAIITCRVAGKGCCRVSGYSKSSRSLSTIVKISCRRNLNLSYNSTSSYISSGFFPSRNTRFRFKFLLCWLLQTTTAAS